MRGVILCGGQSTRMGTDKGMLMLQSRSWAQVAAAKMEVLGLPVSVSVNELQYAAYAGVFAAQQLVKDDPAIDVRGPLLGILSVHQQYPADDLFVLACDMPLMEPAVMQSLLSYYLQQHQHPDACVFTNQNAYQPLCGIYSVNGLLAIQQLQTNGRLVKHSMKFVLENIHTLPLVMAPDQPKYFSNFNTQDALDGL